MLKVLLTIPRRGNRAEIRDRFTKDGYEVLTARDGNEAIATIRNHQPDVAVVDARLELADGLTVSGWVKDHVRLHRVPVILLVEPEELESIQRVVECGAEDVLVKPIHYPELRLRVEMRAENRGRFAGLFVNDELHRLAIQENVSNFLHHHRDREEEILGLMLTDPETGLHNRAYFKIKLDEELRRAQRYDLPLSALLIKVLDSEGDEDDLDSSPISAMTLKEIASVLLLESRDLDVIGRYAPLDLAMLLTNTGQDGAVLLAQRIGERIITHAFSDNVGGRDFQIRFGIATYPLPGVTAPHDLMEQAYEALAKAQSFGTREICIWQAQGS
jgi:diguanylate cyclase (GGDEF)-like protein